jgi:Domain of unknown function (DUF4333)
VPDGMTCTTCFTLNPPGAPACVRCNTPLTADTPEPAAPVPAASPGLAAGPAAVPGLAAGPAAVPGLVAGPAAVPGLAAGPAAVPGMVAGPAAVPGMVAGAVGAGTDHTVDPTEGSKRIGPGLAGAAGGAPGSSRAQAAAVQPPGCGLGTAEPEPPPPATPPPDPRLHRRVVLAGALLVAAVLVAGGIVLWLTRPAYLDSAAVGRTIGDQLTRRLGGPVAVACPGDQRQRAGVTFRCTATDDAGGHRAVTVTVVDNSGKFTWTLGTA